MLRSYYFAQYGHSSGGWWQIHEVWFWQNIGTKVSNQIKILEKKYELVSLEDIKKIS